MATIGTLYINIAAKTGAFVKQVEGTLERAKSAVGKYNGLLQRLAERQKAATKAPSFSLGQKAAAAGLALIATQSTRAAVRVAAFGVKAQAVFGRMAASIATANGLLRLFGLGLGVGVLIAVAAFFKNVVTLAVGRFVELRTKMREVSLYWRQFQLQAARAFAPLIGAVLNLLSKNLRGWIDGGAKGFEGMAASAGYVVAAVVGIVATVRTLWNVVTIVFRGIIGGIMQIIRPLLQVTDLLGLTDDWTTTLDLAFAEMADGVAGDLEDIGAAWDGTFDAMNEAIGAGLAPATGGGNLTEGGLSGSEGAIVEYREQTALLRQIRDSLNNRGPR